MIFVQTVNPGKLVKWWFAAWGQHNGQLFDVSSTCRHGMPFISMVEPAKEKYYTRNKYMMWYIWGIGWSRIDWSEWI